LFRETAWICSRREREIVDEEKNPNTSHDDTHYGSWDGCWRISSSFCIISGSGFVVTPQDLDPREVEFKEMLRLAIIAALPIPNQGPVPQTASFGIH
jgi:hypothetical protein